MSSNCITPKKPAKPYPDFPLTPHASGKWQKKINGRIHYFGRWAKMVDGVLVSVEDDGWSEALALFKAQESDLYAGRPPRVRTIAEAATQPEVLTIKSLLNAFLTAKLRKLEAGEMGAAAFNDYRYTADFLAAELGKNRAVADLTANDFEQLRSKMAKQWGPVRLGNTIGRVKTIFKYGHDNNLTDRLPHYGSEFKKPGKATLRKHRATNGAMMLEPDDLRKLMEKASIPMRAMTLLGLNGGLGNNDVATLPLSAVNLDTGWLDFPRPKTGIARRCPLWPETVAAIRDAIAVRPKPKVAADDALVFLLRTGNRWVRHTDKARVDAVAFTFGKLLEDTGLNRPRLGFYVLRHVFRTIADGCRDQTAIDAVMGHSDPTMAAHSRERIEDSRLRTVVDTVRTWLFAPES